MSQEDSDEISVSSAHFLFFLLFPLDHRMRRQLLALLGEHHARQDQLGRQPVHIASGGLLVNLKLLPDARRQLVQMRRAGEFCRNRLHRIADLIGQRSAAPDRTVRTILLVEQNANMALKIADRCYVLEVGTVKFHGDAKEMQNNDEVRKAYLGSK